MEKLKIKIDDMINIINNMINSCKILIENIKIYYNIEINILRNYNINNLNMKYYKR